MRRPGLPGWLGRLVRGRLVRGRTLSAKLITVMALLLIGAFAIVAVFTYFAVKRSTVAALDHQLQTDSSAYAHCMEYTGSNGGRGSPPVRGGSPPCSGLGQPTAMLGVRINGGRISNCEVITTSGPAACTLTTADRKALLTLPASGPAFTSPHHGAGTPSSPEDGEHGPPPNWSNPPVQQRTFTSSALDGVYRLTVVRGNDGDILITGLPADDVYNTLDDVAKAELAVFLTVLVLAGVLGTVLVRLSLRPLRRVAATASRVAELPLDSGEVSLPPGVPDSDPRTEVGQVGSAFNRMLGHVQRALGRRAASEARLRRFAADASHELRTPLASIRGYAELALRHPGPVPDEVMHALSRVQSESARMSVLVDDLLLLARLDAGRPLDQAPVDLTRLAIDATSDARVAFGDHRWQLDLPDDPVDVLGDEHRLHQVLANLLSNAGKHTPPGATVTVAVTIPAAPAPPGRHYSPPQDAADPMWRGEVPPPPNVEISVTDNGPGIAADLLPDLFERFTRADTSRARTGSNGGSTGLGLAIVEAVVAAHHGCVGVTSVPGRTRFAILLPRAAAS